MRLYFVVLRSRQPESRANIVQTNCITESESVLLSSLIARVTGMATWTVNQFAEASIRRRQGCTSADTTGPRVIVCPSYVPFGSHTPEFEAQLTKVSNVSLPDLIFTLLHEACGEEACLLVDSKQTEGFKSWAISKYGELTSDEEFIQPWATDLILIQRSDTSLTVGLT